MKHWIIASAMALIATTAVAQERAAFFALRGNGGDGWTVTCELRQPNGRSLSQTARGKRRETGYLSNRRVSAATCSYQVPADRPLRLDFDDRRFQCPFTSTVDGLCRTNLPAGSSGRFEVTLRR